jgi:hypothetical protein
VIPAGGFLVGEPPTSKIPNYPLPEAFVLSYRSGAIDFTPRERVPPFTAVVHTTGLFEGALVSGEDSGEFGFRAELRRSGVYGTILIDRLNFELTAIQLAIEGCPDTTVESEETSVPMTLTSEEACPQVTVSTEETSMPISVLVSDA